MFVCKCLREFEKSQSFNSHSRWCEVARGGADKVKRKTFNGRISPFRGKTLEQIHGKSRASSIKQKTSRSARECEYRKPVSEDARINMSIAASNRQTKHLPWFEVGGIKVQGEWERSVCERLLEEGHTLKRHSIRYDSTHHYTPDILVADLNLYIEVKGWLMSRDKVKYRKFCLEHPDLDIRLLMGDDYNRFIRREMGIRELPRLSDCV